MKKHIEILIFFSLLFHLQWLFGNLYEEILTPNSITATVEQLNAYNDFPSITEPYYYYIPLTQIGTLIVFYLAFFSDLPSKLRKPLRFSAAASGLATALTVFIVTEYNMKMFFGDVTRFGEHVHQLYLEWAILNGLRIILIGAAIFFLFGTYRNSLKGNLGESKTSDSK